MEYTIIIEKGEDGYWTYSPELPGCTSFGVSVEETIENMRSAIKEHLELLIQIGEKPPLPVYSFITKVAI